MPTHSAIDLRKVEIPLAAKLADRALDQLITDLEPRAEKRDPHTVLRALRQIGRELKAVHQSLFALLAGSLRVKMPPAEEIEGDKQAVQRALDLLEGTFGTEIGSGSDAESIAVEIAHNHANFHAQMAAMLAAVERISAHSTTEKPAPAVKEVKKPAPKHERKAVKSGHRPAVQQSDPPVQLTVNPAAKPAQKDVDAAVIPLHDTPPDEEPAVAEGEDPDELFRAIVEDQGGPKKPDPVDKSKPKH